MLLTNMDDIDQVRYILGSNNGMYGMCCILGLFTDWVRLYNFIFKMTFIDLMHDILFFIYLL